MVNDKNNLNIEKNNGVLILNIRRIIKVFRNRKWWFAVTFIIVLILSLLFSFSLYKNSHYGAKSQITILLSNNRYRDIISELYPDESDNLWLDLTEDNIAKYLGYIANWIDSEVFINELNKSLNLNLSNNKLRGRISYNINYHKNKLIITTYSDDVETAKKINETLINSYTNNMASSIDANYNVLLSKVRKNIDEDQESKNTEEYNILVSIQKDLVDNKDMYINKINAVSLPEVERYFFNLRDALLAVVVSGFAGMVVLFFVDFIYSKRKNINS
jgi:hypothetical protein